MYKKDITKEQALNKIYSLVSMEKTRSELEALIIDIFEQNKYKPFEITDTWSTIDVMNQFEDDDIGEYEAQLILKKVEKDYDANFGINYNVIETAYKELEQEGVL